MFEETREVGSLSGVVSPALTHHGVTRKKPFGIIVVIRFFLFVFLKRRKNTIFRVPTDFAILSPMTFQ